MKRYVPERVLTVKDEELHVLLGRRACDELQGVLNSIRNTWQYHPVSMARAGRDTRPLQVQYESTLELSILVLDDDVEGRHDDRATQGLLRVLLVVEPLEPSLCGKPLDFREGFLINPVVGIVHRGRILTIANVLGRGWEHRAGRNWVDRDAGSGAVSQPGAKLSAGVGGEVSEAM